MPDTAVMDSPSVASVPSSPSPSSAPPPPSPSESTSGTRLSEAPDVKSDISHDSAWDEPSESTPPSPKTAPAPAPAKEPEAEPEPVADSEPEPEPEVAKAQPAEAESEVELAAEDALEGIIEQTTRAGTKQYVVPEEAFTQVRAAYQTIRRAEEILGEPLTESKLAELQDSNLLQAQLETDLISSDPRSATNILDYLNRRGKSFREAGHTGHDPFTNLANAMPDYLLEQAASDPHAAQAYQAQAEKYMRAVLDNTYRLAREGQLPGLTAEQQQDVFKSAAWIDKVIFDKYSRPEDVRTVDPQVARLAEIDRRENALRQQSTQAATAQWNGDMDRVNAGIQKDTAARISKTLGPVEKYYTDLKQTNKLGGIQRDLQMLVNNAILKDTAWQTARNTLIDRARHAPSAEIRNSLLEQVQQRYDIKARLVLDPARNPKVKEILNEHAVETARQSAADNTRKAAASQRREPTGAGSAPDRSLMPPVSDKPGLWSADEISKAMKAAF